MHIRTIRFTVIPTVLAAWLVLMAGIVRSEESALSSEDIRKLVHQGVTLFEQGKYKEAAGALEKALAQKPDSDLILEFVEQNGYHLFYRMLTKPAGEGADDLTKVARRLLDAAQTGHIRRITDKEAIDKVLTDLFANDFDRQMVSMMRLEVNIGQNAMPQLLPLLGDAKEDLKRIRAIEALNRIRDDAVLPLIEGCNSKNEFMTRNAAIVLGNLRDGRAVPALKRLWENPAADPLTRESAATALQKITGLPPDKLPPPTELYYQLAERYFYEDPSVMVPYHDKAFILWVWNADKGELSSIVVPACLYNEKLAEEACYDSITLAPGQEPVKSLLCAVYLAQWDEIRDRIEVARAGKEKGVVPEGELEDLTKLADRLKSLESIVYSSGEERLFATLARALKDRDVAIAVSAIRFISHLSSGNLLPAAAGSVQK
ncbi:MAG: HEAT repeat domain-containing protein [Planctomycetota bacterium]